MTITYTGHACVGVNRKQIVGCLVAENTAEEEDEEFNWTTAARKDN